MRAGADYLDLESPVDRAKLEDPTGYLQGRNGRLVVLDEVQRLPGLFETLRGIIDQRVFDGEPAGHFLLLGSASLGLLQQASESLAGRISYQELAPLDLLEVGDERREALWVRGGFPRSLLAKTDEDSAAWRADFITTYLERDIPQLGPRIPAATLRRFWTMLAHGQGGLLNASRLARGLAVTGKTVGRYVALLVDLMLVRRLPPHVANIGKRLVRSPKIYIRDSGLVHSLLRLHTREELLGHPVVGTSWEGFVVETLINGSPPGTEATFFRTAAGAEVDLLLRLPGGDLWAIEVKRSLAPSVGRGFRHAIADLAPARALVLYPGEDRYPLPGGVEVVGLVELASELTGLT